MRRAFFLAAIVSFLALPAFAQDWAKAKLEKSPRHGEWVDIKHGNRTLKAFVVYPEVANKATAVVVIHEIFGLTEWAQLAADELAEAGYIAIAPDFVSAPGGAGLEARRAVSQLPPKQVLADLNAAADYVKGLPASNGKVAVAGFCWGGGKAFDFATHRKDLSAAFVFYGAAPREKASLANIECPVYGFYAQNDARISSGIPDTERAMKEAGKTYHAIVYPDAGHGFMRAGEDPKGNAGNKSARQKSLQRMKSILAKI